jgi:ribosomal protein L37E
LVAADGCLRKRNADLPYRCPLCGKKSWHPDDACHGHCAACGANRLQAGVYEVKGSLHVNLMELLDAAGWKVTEENLDRMAKAARDVYGAAGIPVVEIRPVRP